MRILLTADPLLPVPPQHYGGIERIVAALAEEYRAQGHTVALLAKAGSTAVVDQFYPWPFESVRGASATLRNSRALRRAARDFKADVVHSFSRLAYLLPLLATTRIPALMSYQRHTGGPQIRWARRLGGERLRFTGCSEFICIQGRRAGGTWTAVPNFVDLRKYRFSPQVDRNAPLVFLSRIESIKGADLAIAIAQKAGRKLILAGNRPESGPEARYFKEKIAPQLGHGGIEWIGEVDDAKKAFLLGAAAALLVPIQWDEPFGIVFVEALATGTPVLTCARGAAPEIIEKDRTGLFISTVDDGVAAVSALASLDRAACRSAAETRFSLTVCASHYLALLREACL